MFKLQIYMMHVVLMPFQPGFLYFKADNRNTKQCMKFVQS